RFAHAELQARGHKLTLPNTGPVYTRTALQTTDNLLMNFSPVAVSVNQYGTLAVGHSSAALSSIAEHKSLHLTPGPSGSVPLHHAVQVVLSNCAVISFIFDHGMRFFLWFLWFM